MTQTPFSHAESLRIGTVDYISPDEVKVLLDIEAPESVALNAGGARPFPRVNSYVLMPVDDGFLVGQIEWLTIERSPFPKRRGIQDFGLIDLPYPLRKLRANPLGILRKRSGPGDHYSFRRGADALPSVGAAVLIPTDNQLRSIIESGERRRVRIGISPLAGNAEVCIDPDRLFGRHLAVLGNTGSGKSCSVAGLVRWSLNAAKSEVVGTPKGGANARFIILDPNGEYSRAFKDAPDFETTIFRIEPDTGEVALQVPLWFWNSAEWCSFSQASSKMQRPLLKRALREVKAGRVGLVSETEEERKLTLRRYLSSVLIILQRDLRSAAIKTDPTKCGIRLRATYDDIENKNIEAPADYLVKIKESIKAALAATYSSFTDKDTHKTIPYYKPFTELQITNIIAELNAALVDLGGIVYQDGPDEDVPLPFKGTDLADHLAILSDQENVTQYLDFLISRIRSLLSDSKTSAVIGDSEEVTLEQWLNDYIGGDLNSGSHVSILDLSLVPTEVVHVITAVTARIVFEALQRHRRLKKVPLPTVLVMEEAHTFIKRYSEDLENQNAASICCQVFERIAREGRKFGLGLVLSSQRPSELSPTVLSQCNTFLLHRISNDRDQELVHRLVPDNLRGLLRELPSLPSQHAILLGWASELPILVKMDDLPKAQQPHSDDPDFWNVWTRKEDRQANWKDVAAEWQRKGAAQCPEGGDDVGDEREAERQSTRGPFDD